MIMGDLNLVSMEVKVTSQAKKAKKFKARRDK